MSAIIFIFISYHELHISPAPHHFFLTAIESMTSKKENNLFASLKNTKLKIIYMHPGMFVASVSFHKKQFVMKTK
jgi:hypothetical protein